MENSVINVVLHLDRNLKTRLCQNLHIVVHLQVKKLPGIELSKEEQLQQIALLRKQLTLKRDLLNKYRSLSLFDRDPQP